MASRGRSKISKKITTDMVLQILEDGAKPRSIKEIHEKYEPTFPFFVKKVTERDEKSPLDKGHVLLVDGVMTVDDVEYVYPSFGQGKYGSRFVRYDGLAIWVLA